MRILLDGVVWQKCAVVREAVDQVARCFLYRQLCARPVVWVILFWPTLVAGVAGRSFVRIITGDLWRDAALRLLSLWKQCGGAGTI